jgi:hypothetical protein
MRILGMCLTACLTVVAAANAGTITFEPYSQGSYYSSNGSANGNYRVGLANNIERRSFFIFDLTGLTGTVTAAELLLWCPSNCYGSDESTETFELWDFTGSITDLAAGGTAHAPALYADLGTGTSYGSFTISSTDENTLLSFILNSQAVAALNSAGGSDFAIGGRMPSADSYNEFVFGYTFATQDQRLVLTYTDLGAAVPEPATLTLVGLALTAGRFGLARRRAKRAQEAR